MNERRIDGIQVGDGGTCLDVARELLLEMSAEVYLADEVTDQAADLTALVLTSKGTGNGAQRLISLQWKRFSFFLTLHNRSAPC